MQKLAKVLLVDDDITTTYLNTQLLKRLEVAEELLVAHNGLEALQLLDRTCHESDEAANPMLVLLDVKMPVMNGIEFLAAYQQHPLAQKCHLVIIVLTTSAHGADLERIRRLGNAAEIMAKPLTQEKVKAILQRHFHRSLSER